MQRLCTPAGCQRKDTLPNSVLMGSCAEKSSTGSKQSQPFCGILKDEQKRASGQEKQGQKGRGNDKWLERAWPFKNLQAWPSSEVERLCGMSLLMILCLKYNFGVASQFKFSQMLFILLSLMPIESLHIGSDLKLVLVLSCSQQMYNSF